MFIKKKQHMTMIIPLLLLNEFNLILPCNSLMKSSDYTWDTPFINQINHFHDYKPKLSDYSGINEKDQTKVITDFSLIKVKMQKKKIFSWPTWITVPRITDWKSKL